MMRALSIICTMVWLVSPLSVRGQEILLDGVWEGILTQDRGGYAPEYSLKMTLQQQGNKLTGIVEVTAQPIGGDREEVYIKHEISGTLTRGFFLELEDGAVLNKKELQHARYCRKTYQLVLDVSGEKPEIRGRWQGTAGEGDCVPGKIRLLRTIDRV